jgi:hypothetical protein
MATNTPDPRHSDFEREEQRRREAARGKLRPPSPSLPESPRPAPAAPAVRTPTEERKEPLS